MTSAKVKRSQWSSAATLTAVRFGLLTIVSGGLTLFTTPARQMAGNFVPFVLWFNFLAGFAYVLVGVGLWRRERWAAWGAAAIAIATLLVFVAFGLRIWSGGSFEPRTVAAMGLRLLIWLWISGVAFAN